MAETRTINQAQAAKIARALTDYGYDGITTTDCLASASSILAGNEPTEIIGMFIERILEDGGVKDRE